MHFVLAFLNLGLVFGPSPATAGEGPALTGSWEGAYTCKTADSGGKGTLEVEQSTLTIVQLGPSGPLVVDERPYAGTLVPSASGATRGAGAWIACGTRCRALSS